MSTATQSKGALEVSVRPLSEQDLAEAGRIFSVAFGTFIGLPNPEEFGGDRAFVSTRWRANPEGALAAEADGKLAGSNFVTRWGSFGFFGPLTVRPDLWDRGVARKLLGPTVDLFDRWGVRAAGLYTFSNSGKHVALYQKFGFWPGYLTALMSTPSQAHESSTVAFSSMDEAKRNEALRATREVTESIFAGLDVTGEIRSVHEQGLGETLLLWGGGRLEGFAVCHCGAGTEGGKDRCYAKFAAVRSNPGAPVAFERLLDACESLAHARGLSRLTAGVNTGRREAYRRMLQRGYRVDMLGVSMLRPESPAYNRPDVFAIDDWR